MLLTSLNNLSFALFMFPLYLISSRILNIIKKEAQIHSVSDQGMNVRPV